MLSSLTKQMLAGFAFLTLPAAVHAQDDKTHPIEVRGNGRMAQEQRTLKPFTELHIEYLHGVIKVEVGGTTPTLEIQLDENLKPFLVVKEQEGTLKLSLRNKQGVPVWTSKATISAVIKTPSLNAGAYSANGTLTVSGLNGTSFSLVNKANGQITLNGTVDRLQVVNMANGYIDAEALTVQQANVVAKANGTTRVNAKKMSVMNSGHGSVINVVKKQ